jgi:hypothetical protein
MLKDYLTLPRPRPDLQAAALGAADVTMTAARPRNVFDAPPAGNQSDPFNRRKGGVLATTATRRAPLRGVDRPGWVPVETKPFFMTSEFAFFALMSLALLITAAVDDSIDARTFWLLQVPLTIGYLLSRGIAKAGSRTPSYDPRDEALVRARERADDRD